MSSSAKATTVSVYNAIYAYVAQIPAGRVSTYAEVALAVGTHPRVVGNALHKNPNPARVPCHRVVNSRGALAQNFAFGGSNGQAQRLQAEGVIVTQNTVSLEHYRNKN